MQRPNGGRFGATLRGLTRNRLETGPSRSAGRVRHLGIRNSPSVSRVLFLLRAVPQVLTRAMERPLRCPLCCGHFEERRATSFSRVERDLRTAHRLVAWADVLPDGRMVASGIYVDT